MEEKEKGREVVAVHTGETIASLVRIGPLPPRIPGLAKGEVTKEFFKPLPKDEIDLWE